MSQLSLPRVLLLLVFLLASVSCDRNVEPFVPGETPSQPDLSRIFPEPEAEHDHDNEAARPAAAANRGSPIRGTVALGPGIALDERDGAVLFIMARPSAALGGPPAAVVRIPNPRFPLEFEIGPAQMMSEEMRFEGDYTLTARLDLDGNALSKLPGDLDGTVPGAVSAGSEGVSLVLDRQI